MPANEATWRDTKLLHRVFAVTGVIMTVGTVWMFWKDHARNWKTYQVEINNVDLKINQLRQEQYQTGDALIEHERRQRELAVAKASPIDESHLDHFKSAAEHLNDKVLRRWQDNGFAYTLVAFDAGRIDRESEN
jgi:hypothetical protein